MSQENVEILRGLDTPYRFPAKERVSAGAWMSGSS
jgi:hypothetical protein